MKIIVLKKNLPLCISKSVDKKEALKEKIYKPLINKSQQYKSSSADAFLKNEEEKENEKLHFFFRPDHLTNFKHFAEDDRVVFMGLPGMYNKELAENLTEEDITVIRKNFKKYNFHPVLLDYNNFSGRSYSSRLENIFNYCQWNDMFLKYSDEPLFKDYKALNKIFFEEVQKIYETGDIIWIFDYDFWLIPHMARDSFDCKIGVTILSPFPNVEVYRTVLCPKMFLESLLQANYIEFQSHTYMDNFKMCCNIFLNLTIGKEDEGNFIDYNNHEVKLGTNKMGIYVDIDHILNNNEFKEKLNFFTNLYKNKRIIVAAYNQLNTADVKNVLMSIEAFLYKYKNGNIAVVLLELLNENNEIDYDSRDENNRMIEFIKINYPNCVIDIYYPIVENVYYSLLSISDIGLFLDERGSTNNSALHYMLIQNKKGNKSPYVLTSAFSYFDEGIIPQNEETKNRTGFIKVNPKDSIQIADLLYSIMNGEIKTENLYIDYIHNNTVDKWIQKFVRYMEEYKTTKIRTNTKIDEIFEKYKKAKNRLICLDYDGTLTKLVSDPDAAFPDDDLLKILDNLSDKNEVYIITGRGYKNIGKWITNTKIKISAEHGYFLRTDKEWQREENDLSWKQAAAEIINFFIERTPGSHYEEKETCVCFHYRNADPKIGLIQAKALKSAITKIFKDEKNIDIMEGKCIVEVRLNTTNKGSVLKKVMNEDHDFILLAGDDTTDEDMFKVGLNNEKIISIIVGDKLSKAKYRINCVDAMRKLLKDLTEL